MIIDIYGLIIQCQTESRDLAFELIRPFDYFKKEEGQAQITIMVQQYSPPYGTFPPVEANFSTPRNIVYKDKENKIIDYFGKGVVIENNQKTLYHIYSTEKDFLLEVFYLLVLSLFGQFCDKKGLLRVHALALSYKNSAFLFLVTPGGGKSTLALAMLQKEGIKLISDDEAIFNKKGEILPFPLRIGSLGKESIAFIPEKYIYKIDRIEFGEKYFVELEYWKGKIENRPLNKIYLIPIRRLLNGDPSIRQLSKTRALKSLTRDAVIGIGLYQGLEFIFSKSGKEIISKIPIVFKRFLAAIRLAHSSKDYEFITTREMDRNIQVLDDFIKKSI